MRWFRLSLRAACVAALAVSSLAWGFPVPVSLPTVDGSLVAKAAPDECFDGIGTNYPSGPPCATGRPKVNQAYVWGLAKNGTQLWFGTAPNTHCLVQGVFLGSTGAYSNDSWVCEFGESQPARLGIPPTGPQVLPAGALPATLGDFRPPRILVYDTVTRVTTAKSLAGPAAALLATTVGIRAAGTLGDVVLLAGPALSGGINVFAFRASTGALVGAQNLPSYANIRKFAVVNGVLYAGVGRRPSTPAVPGEKLGRILRWTGSLAGPVIAFEEVARIDSMAAELAVHEGRIFVTSWPDGGPSVGAREAGLYMSPPLPAGGFVAAGLSDWTKVWTASEYEPDPVTASTYGGGALASFNGYLYWGTMHVPTLSTLAHFQVYTDDRPTDTQGQLQWFAASERAISIFRGRDFSSGTPLKEVVYGSPSMQVFVKSGASPGSWQSQPNRMGPPRWGPAGFNYPLNNYTWSMAVSGGRLWVGTMDWSWLLASGVVNGISPAAARAALGVSGAAAPVTPDLDALAGADLWYFPAADSPAFPESTTGVGNPASYGIRNMVTGPNLYLGMANPMNLLTDPAAGPTGGWELLELSERAPNTRSGRSSTVTLDEGLQLTFCNVARAGFTTSRALSLDSFLPGSASLPWRPGSVLLVTSSADWRSAAPAECGANGLARISVPYAGLSSNSRMLQLVWVPADGTWAWRDITTSVSDAAIEGSLTAEFLGVVAIQTVPTIPTVGPIVMFGMMLLLGAAGLFRVRRRD